MSDTPTYYQPKYQIGQTVYIWVSGEVLELASKIVEAIHIRQTTGGKTLYFYKLDYWDQKSVPQRAIFADPTEALTRAQEAAEAPVIG